MNRYGQTSWLQTQKRWAPREIGWYFSLKIWQRCFLWPYLYTQQTCWQCSIQRGFQHEESWRLIKQIQRILSSKSNSSRSGCLSQERKRWDIELTEWNHCHVQRYHFWDGIQKWWPTERISQKMDWRNSRLHHWKRRRSKIFPIGKGTPLIKNWGAGSWQSRTKGWCFPTWRG